MTVKSIRGLIPLPPLGLTELLSIVCYQTLRRPPMADNITFQIFWQSGVSVLGFLLLVILLA